MFPQSPSSSNVLRSRDCETVTALLFRKPLHTVLLCLSQKQLAVVLTRERRSDVNFTSFHHVVEMSTLEMCSPVLELSRAMWRF